jgi:hypothetical protein
MFRILCSIFGVLSLSLAPSFGDDSTKSDKKDPNKASPLQMRLIAKKETYTLDLGGKSGKEFREFLEKLSPLKEEFPPAPTVDLVLEITNTSDKDVTIWIGGEETNLTFELKGEGAVNKVVTYRTTADIKISTSVTLAPNKSYTLPIQSLDFPHPRPTRRWYWTEPGEYTLIATYQLGDSKTEGEEGKANSVKGPKLVSEPIKLKVQAK